MKSKPLHSILVLYSQAKSKKKNRTARNEFFFTRKKNRSKKFCIKRTFFFLAPRTKISANNVKKKEFSFNTLIRNNTREIYRTHTKQNSLLAKSSFLSKLLKADEENIKKIQQRKE